MTLTEAQREYVDGLRAVAGWFEQNPEFIQGGASIHVSTPTAAGLAAAAKALGSVNKTTFGSFFAVEAEFGPHTIFAAAPRDRVCEWVATGTETVEVPDPDAPLVTVEREVGEWVCSPLLAKATA